MTRRAKLAAVVGLSVLGVAAAALASGTNFWNQNQDAGGTWHIKDLPAPAGPTEPPRTQDVAPGTCIPKSTGANTLPLVCSMPGTDYLISIGTSAGNYDRVSVAASGLVTGGAAMIVANVAALEALAGANYRDGSRVYVQSVFSDFVFHTTSTQTVDHIMIASVSGMANARWLRAPPSDGTQWNQLSWFIDTGAGSDENDCVTSGTACKTFAEIRRRLLSRYTPIGATNSITVTVTGDLGDTDPIAVEMQPDARNLAVNVVVLGVPTVTSLGTIASVTAHSYSTNQADQITITGLDWTPYVGKIIRRVGTTGTTGQTSVVVAVVSTGVARVTPVNVFSAAGTAWSAAQQVEVLTLPKAVGAKANFPGGMQIEYFDFNPATGVTFQTISTGNLILSASTVLGTASGAFRDVGSGIQLAGCALSTRTFSAIGQFGADRSLLLNATVTVSNSRVGRNEWQDSILVGTSNITLGEGAYTRFHSLGIYGLAAAATGVTFSSHANAEFTDFVYGTGNNATARVFSLLDDNTIALGSGSASIVADPGILANIAGVNVAPGTLPYYRDQYGNSITGAQSTDLPAHVAITGSDLTGFYPNTSVTGIRESSGPTHLPIGAITSGQFLQDVSGSIVGTTTIPGASVGLTAGEVGFGSPSNTLTGSTQFLYTDSFTTANVTPAITLGDGSTTTGANIVFNQASGVVSQNLRWRQAGTTYSTLGATRDGTATTGRVTSGVSVTPVAGGSGNDYFEIRQTASGSAQFRVWVQNGDVAAAGLGSSGGDEIGGGATNGFLFIPRSSGAMTGVPALVGGDDGVSSGLRQRAAMAFDRLNNRLYIYDATEPAWHYVKFDDGATAGSAITALTNDVTATGPGSATATIAGHAVTYAKMQQASTHTLLGNPTGSTADVSEITLGSGLAFSGTTLVATGAGTVTNVTATLPLASSGGATPNIVLQFDNASLTLSGGNALQRAALTNDVTAAAGSNVTTLANIPNDVPMAGDLLAAVMAAPGTAPSGKARIYVDSTSKNLSVKNDANTVNHAAQSFTAAAHQFATALANDGSWTTAQPVEADVVNLVTDLASKVPTTRTISTTAPLAGGGDLSADRTLSISANGITDSLLRQGAAHSFVGRAANSLGNLADIPCTNDGDVAWQSGTTLGCSPLAYSKLTGAPTIFYQTWQNAGSDLAQRAKTNASTGLTAADNSGNSRTDLTVNLSTGLAGGQSVIGGTAASENLTLSSTTNGTKGSLRLGSSTNVWDEALAGFSLGGGTLVSGEALRVSNKTIRVTGTSSANLVTIENTTSGTGAYTEFALYNNAGPGSRASIYYTSTTYTGADSFPSSLNMWTEGGISSHVVMSPNNTITVDALPGNAAINGVTPASNESLTVGHASVSTKDHVRFFVGGGSLWDSTNSFFDLFPSNTAITGTNGIWATERVRPYVITAASGSPTVTEAVGLYVEGPTLSGVGVPAGGGPYDIHGPNKSRFADLVVDQLGSGTGIEQVVTADSAGNLGTAGNAPVQTLTFRYNNQAINLLSDRRRVILPTNGGFGNADTLVASAGTDPKVTLAANWFGTGFTYPIPNKQYKNLSCWVDVGYAIGSGSGAGTIQFAVYEVVTDPTSSTNYTAHVSATIPVNTTGASHFQGANMGTSSGLGSVASLAFAVYRTDLNSGFTVDSLSFGAVCTVW